MRSIAGLDAATVARSRGLQALALSFAIAVAVLLWVDSIGGPIAVRDRYGLWAPVLSFAFHTAVELTPFGDVLPWGFANGALYGWAMGTLVTWAAWVASAGLQYGIARRTASDFDLDRRREKLPRWLRSLPLDHAAFLILARWVPMGGPIANVAAGVLGVRAHRLLACAAIGAAPPAVFVAGVGAGALRLF